jgi:enoyl-CoA hydratase/carnithine racemase
MHGEPVLLAIDGAVARLTLARPAQHNALGAAEIARLGELLDDAVRHPDVRALVLTATGDRTFCSGAALDELEDGSLSGARFDALTAHIATLELPTVCALNGSVYGGGAEIALACDYRIGVEGMRLLVPAARIGLCYPPGGIRRYVAKLGLDTTLRILMGAEEFDAEVLHRTGYLHRVVAAERLADEADALARHLAALAPLAVRAMKRIAHEAANGTLDLRRAEATARACTESADLAEGLRARREKRAPRFAGN